MWGKDIQLFKRDNLDIKGKYFGGRFHIHRQNSVGFKTQSHVQSAKHKMAKWCFDIILIKILLRYLKYELQNDLCKLQSVSLAQMWLGTKSHLCKRYTLQFCTLHRDCTMVQSLCRVQNCKVYLLHRCDLVPSHICARDTLCNLHKSFCNSYFKYLNSILIRIMSKHHFAILCFALCTCDCVLNPTLFCLWMWNLPPKYLPLMSKLSLLNSWISLPHTAIG